jgi:GT2 family glycosyltransferase
MKNILIGIPVKNTGKYLENLFDQLVKLDYDHKYITISLVESDSKDDSYEICKNIKSKYNNIFKDIYINKLDFGFDLNHNLDRYNQDKFPNRIKNLIITRNFIVDNYLSNNDYLWWVDSDFEFIPNNTINLFIESNKDIIIPMLTHKTWGYHDCGSVVFDGEKQHRFQYIESENNLVKLDRADTHCFIKKEVFDKIKYKFISESYYDGCGGMQNCWSDGTYFSIEAIKKGFGLYGAKHIVIKHHDI